MSLFILFIIFSTTILKADDFVRAALDVGSGKTKMLVVKIDPDTKEPIEELFSEQTDVLLGLDWRRSSNNEPSSDILNKAKETLRNYQIIAKELGADQIVGVATAVFRDARNGPSFIEEVKKDLGIDLYIISQETEGKLGFLSAASGQNVPFNQIIAFDSGSSSFQISSFTDGRVNVYEGPWGISKVVGAMVETVQKSSLNEKKSPNPISLEQCLATINIIKESLPHPSSELRKKIVDQNKVCCITL